MALSAIGALRPARVHALPAGFQEFLLPIPSVAARMTFAEIDNDPNITLDSDMHYVVGITASADNTTIYYDHWENGLLSGASGDEVHVLNKGEVLVLESSDIPTDPRGSSTYYDGGDRIYTAGGPLQVMVAMWPEETGTVFAESLEVYPLQAWENTHVIPIGEDLSSAPLSINDFSEVWLHVMSSSNDNDIVIADPDGNELTNLTLDRGEEARFQVQLAGTTVTGGEAIQVNVFAGVARSGITSEVRGFVIAPQPYWDSHYLAPVPGWDARDMDLLLYNPGDAAITIEYEDLDGSGSFVIAAKSARSYEEATGRYVPEGSGVELIGTDVFWGVGLGDTGSGDYDWGYDLIPIRLLGTDNYVSWAPGTRTLADNGSPVYVMAMEDDTTIFVDYGEEDSGVIRSDGVVDAVYIIDRLEVIKLFDPDNDNTGMHLVSDKLIALAWGQDIDTASIGDPYLDMGYTALPLPLEWIDIALQMEKSASPTTATTGQEVTFTLTISVPTGADTVTEVIVEDTLPPGWEYINGSSSVGEPTIDGTVAAGLTLSWEPAWNIDGGASEVITFRARPTFLASTEQPNRNVSAATGVVGLALLTADDDAFVSVVHLPLLEATKRAELTDDADGNGVASPGDTLTYSVVISNTGYAEATGVVYNDTPDANTSLIVGSVATAATVTSGNTDGDASIGVDIGTLAVDDHVEISYQVVINDPLPDGVTEVVNQGIVSSNELPNVPTDDPVPPGAEDPTVVPLALASIRGVVFEDLDGDGVQEVGEPGIAGVTITIRDGNGDLVTTVTTEEDGSYQVLNLVPGDYRVEESDPSGYRSTTPNTVDVNVPSGGVAEADFGDQRLGEVNGTLYIDANGDGQRDPGEAPLADVTVVITDSLGAIYTVQTDANGFFSQTVPAGPAIVDVDDSTLPSGLRLTTDAHGEGTDPTPVTVPQGGAATDNTGYLALGSISGVVFNDLDGDGVQEPGESGIPDVTVELRDSQDNVIGTTTTGPDGAYLFANVVPGEYTVVEVDPTGYTSTTPNSVGVTVPSGGTGNADFGDRQPGTVAGVVFNDLDGDGVQDPGESGIPGVTVELRDSQNNVIGTTTTGPDGTYLFVNVAPGEYTVVEIDPSGFGSTTPNNVGVTVPSGGTGNADFGDQQPGTVAGVVFNDLDRDGVEDPGEARIANVVVSLLDDAGTVVATTTTNDNGEYRFTGLAPGPYEVVVTTPDGHTATIPVRVGVSVPPNGNTVVDFSFVQADPTAITLAFFNAVLQPDGSIAIEWTTMFEANTLGYRVLASADGKRESAVVVSSLLPGKGTVGGDYQVALSAEQVAALGGTPQNFWLVEVSSNGEEEYGPFQLTLPMMEQIFLPMMRR